MEMNPRPAPRMGMTARNSRASRAFTKNAITMEKIRVEGARTAMRMSIWKVF